MERVPNLPTAVSKAPRAKPSRDPDPEWETWTPTTTWDSARAPTHPAAADPRMVDRPDLRVEDHPEDRRKEDHLVDPRAEGHQAGDPPMYRWRRTSPRTSRNESCTSR